MFIEAMEQGIQPTSKAIRLELGINEEDCITIPVYPNTREDQEKREKFKRAKEKRRVSQIIEEQLEEIDDYENR